MPDVAAVPEIAEMLRANCPVAIGVSGGKDSSAVAFATVEHLDRIGHTGPRVLIHSDLGRVEWKDSLPACERLADRLKIELLVCRRAAGDMMDRWQTRWNNNVERYTSLSCVKLIPPWSTASMRFCTSEMKTDQICATLTKRWPGCTIISVSGIRRQESPNRAKAPTHKPQPKLSRTRLGTRGFDWNAIIEWTLDEVLGLLKDRDFPLHEAYTVYGSSRVSCVCCILGSKADLRAAAGCADNHDIYRLMVDLEIVSTFSFQDASWLGDVAPELLTDIQRTGLARAKAAVPVRQEAEAQIPAHLLYTSGWPTCVPTGEEARLLAEVRTTVANVVGLPRTFTDPDQIVAR